MDGRMSSGGSVRRVKSFSARPLLLFAHEKCQGKRATGSHAVFRVKAALQMVKFCPKLQPDLSISCLLVTMAAANT
jgi:hypothetical protein